MKTLLIRFSSIGDIVLTSPVVRCLKEQTGTELHFLTKGVFAGTLVHSPYIDRLWTIEKDVAEVVEQLSGTDFTHLIDLHGNLRSAQVKWYLRAAALKRGHRPPRMATFDKLNVQKFLLTRLKIDRMPALHIVDRYLAAARQWLPVANDGRGLDYFVAPREEVAPPLPRPYVAFVIGAAHATKRLEEGQMIEVCRRLTQPVLLLGGPGEKALGERVARAGGNHVYDGCGNYPLNGSASLVRQAAVVLTHDTGLMHIAAAYRRPIVSMWGNTVPAFGMTPYLPEGEACVTCEVAGLNCRPCSKIGYAACPQGHFRCMREQDLERIVAKINRLFLLDA